MHAPMPAADALTKVSGAETRGETPLKAKGKMVLQQASVKGIGNTQNHTILKCPSDSVDWSEKTSCSVRRFMVIASLRHDRTRV